MTVFIAGLNVAFPNLDTHDKRTSYSYPITNGGKDLPSDPPRSRCQDENKKVIILLGETAMRENGKGSREGWERCQSMN